MKSGWPPGPAGLALTPGLLSRLMGIAGPTEPKPSSPSPPDPDGRQAARALVSYSPSLAQPLSASPALRFWESQPVIRALIRQDFLPATARGGGRGGREARSTQGEVSQPGTQGATPTPHWQMPFRGLQHTSPTLWLLSEDIEAQRGKGARPA